jgi:tripartite-type tricarboxylate transporter receptor subunit TctC
MQARLLTTASLVAAMAASAAAPAFAQAPAEFYKGRNVTVLVGFSPGGGYDQYARLLSRHMGRHVPGAPDMIVQNLPGAGSLNAVRQIDATQAKDGTVIGAFNPGLITESLTDPVRTKFNFSEVAWVGSITRDFRVCYLWSKLGVKNWDEMLKRKEVIFGGTGKGTGNYVNGAILRNLFGVNVKQVLGFPGSAEQRLAIERGELDGDCGSWSSVPVEWIKDNKVTPIVTFSPVDSPDLPKGVPYLGKFATTAEQRDVLELLSAAGELGRPFIMSKAVPGDRLQAMRKAFDETMKDSAFLADAQKLLLPVNPIGGEEAEKIIAGIYKSSPEVVAKAKEVME